MPIAWQSRRGKHTIAEASASVQVLVEVVAVAMMCAVREVAFVILIVLGALKIQQLVCAAFDHTAPFCPSPVRGLDAELAACCCVSVVVFGDALQASSSRKYCKSFVSNNFFNGQCAQLLNLRSFLQPSARHP